MKLVVILIFLITLTYSQSTEDDNMPTYSELKSKVVKDFAHKSKVLNLPEYEVLLNTDMNCVDKKLKYDDNKKKPISRHLGYSAIHLASIFCSEDPNKFYDLEFKMAVDSYKNMNNFYVNCLKVKLKEFEPNSELLENFNPTESEIKSCHEKEPKQNYLEKCDNELLQTDEDRKEVARFAVIVTTQDENSTAFNAAKLKHQNLAQKVNEKAFQCLIDEIAKEIN